MLPYVSITGGYVNFKAVAVFELYLPEKHISAEYRFIETTHRLGKFVILTGFDGNLSL